MGHWSQSRRHGGGGSAAPALPTPPGPGLIDEDGDLHQRTEIENNEYGQVTLYFSADGFAPYTPVSSADWSQDQNWGDLEFLATGYYKGTQTGNGIAWQGESPLSNRIPI